MAKRRQPTSLRGELLEARRLLAFDSLIISEFMASNDRVLVDEDGEFSDWIELYNPTDTRVSLEGWSLTDDADNLAKWVLPEANLDPHAYLLVFASGKDRRTDDGPLHTNFRLDDEGEFLGLASPAGTLVHSFGDRYPPQHPDTAYGLPIDQQPLITTEHPGRYRVPQPPDADLGSDWTSWGFDDTAWSTSIGAVGYDLRLGVANAGFEAGDLSEWTASGETRAITSAAGETPSQGNWHASLLANATSVTRFNLETFLGLSRSTLNRVGNVTVTRGSALKRTLTVEAGTEIQLDWNFLTDEPRLNGSQDFAFLSISPGNEVFQLAGVTDATRASATPLDRETGYQTFRYTFAEAGEYTLGVGVVNEANQFLDSGLRVDNLLIDGVGSLEDTFNALLETSVEAELADVNSSLWLRQAFTVEDVEGIDSLELRVRYDDGLAIYLNGELLGRENVGENAAWNSVASTDRDDRQALSYQIDTIDPTRLRSGENVLALQAFKSAADDPNVLLQAELTALGQVTEVPVFLQRPTPGSANLSDSFGFVETVQFSVPHGFYDQPFELTLSTPTVDADIRYTLDGSAPTLANSMPYEGPVFVDHTQTVRAVALKQGLRPSRPATQSYLFIEDVVTQDRSAALSRGFPNAWGDFQADYAMDRRIIGQNGADRFGGVYAETVREDLKAIPSLSLVMDFDDLFGDQGIYSHPFERGVAWERPTSLELIYPDGREGFQVDAGIRVQGGISRFISSKLSLRLLFKDDYGPSKLEFPFFGPEAGNQFDSISLRSSSGEHLVGIHYIRDEFTRRSQLMTGNTASHGNYMHLYINGLYWGVYNPAERIDGQFAANYFGGDKDDYDVLNAGDLGNEGVSAVAGSLDAWNRLVELAGEVERARTEEDKTAAYLRLQGLNPDGTANPEWESYLDVDNYIDYLITQLYVRNGDWPIRNYYMLRRRGPDSTGFKFYVWDAEFTLDRGDRASITEISREGPGVIYRSLDSSEAFRIAFSDRVQLHFSPGGAYYVNPDDRSWDPEHPEDNLPASLYAAVAEEVFAPLGPESARWGDEMARNGRLFVRDTEWAQTLATNLREFFPNRSRDFLVDLRANEFYRDAPELSPAGGLLTPGQTVQIRPRTGTAYYTLDGTDPRNPDGSVSDSALPYEGPLVIDQRTTLLTRSLRASEWSALKQVTYYTAALPAGADSIRIAEINYNPHDALTALGEADVDNDEFEFIEIVNVSDTAVELEGVRLVQVDGQGVDFTFGPQQLAAGQRVVVGRNRAALISRFGDTLPLAQEAHPDASPWGYEGRLGNGGETLTLETAAGDLAQRLSYDDQAGWPIRADGGGSSLELIDLAADASTAANYRSSRDVGGSPGRAASSATGPLVINEVLANPGAAAPDQIEIYNPSDQAVDLGRWYLTDSENDLLQYAFPDNTRLPAGGYVVVGQQELGFGLSGSRGDQVLLVSADARGRPLQFVDQVQFDASAVGVSLGRWPNGAGRLFPMEATSLGAPNVGPLLGEAIISEVHYHPRDPDGVGALTGEDFEYVELFNRSDQPLNLSGWRLSGDAQYVFADNTILAAGDALVVTRFDPLTHPTLASAFGLTYSLPADAQLEGPGQIALGDAQGSIRLERPTLPVAGNEGGAWILVDRLDYSSELPWPDDLQASGRSLQRVAESAFANLPGSWIGRRAAPGRVDFATTLPGDVTGDGQVDVADVDHLCSAVRRGEAASGGDLNRDGRVDRDDLQTLITGILQTRAGDANLDGLFNSTDLVSVFVASEYEDGIPDNSTWGEGDWNCDGEFTTGDFVVAFLAGGYTAASRAAEPGPPPQGGHLGAALDVSMRIGAWETDPSPRQAVAPVRPRFGMPSLDAPRPSPLLGGILGPGYPLAARDGDPVGRRAQGPRAVSLADPFTERAEVIDAIFGRLSADELAFPASKDLDLADGTAWLGPGRSRRFA